MPRLPAAEKTLMDAIDSYLRNCEATGKSAATMDSYVRRMNQFYAFMVESGLFRQTPTFTTIQAYRDDMLSRGCSPTFVRQCLVELRSFFAYASSPDLGENRFYDANPVSLRLYPDVRKIGRRPYDLLLTDEQVMKLWRNTPIQTNRPEFWPRNYAIVILLLTTEIRNAELLALTLADLNFETGCITVEHGKGDKYRLVDFPEIAQTAIRAYLASGIRPAGLPDTALLFGTTAAKEARPHASDGVWKRGTTQWLSSLVERHVRAVTGVEKIRTHDLRHVGARLDLNNGMTTDELQQKLGHFDPKTTQRYSGRLLSRGDRKSAAKVYAERDYQARRNLDRLSSASTVG